MENEKQQEVLNGNLHKDNPYVFVYEFERMNKED